MYTKEEREGILGEFHRSGMDGAEACRRLPFFPTRTNLYRWLKIEEAGELAAALDEYIEWYRSGKLKKALGWRTIRQFREELAAA